jgi:AP-4 complex subunit beta-1
LVQKKLVYLYLGEYAGSHSEITLLAVNTLQKDCRDSNPMVRGLALRSMCGLRVDDLVEYVLQPLQDGLRDKSPYVRKTAVLGCVKLFYTSESVVHECNIPDTLYSMVKDRDELVMANAVVALDEILSRDGGIVLTSEIANRLFQTLANFPPWCQCQLMAILVRYVPADEDEVVDILNLLDDRLKNANSGVVMAAMKLFLHFTRNMDGMLEDVMDRIKQPMITQMASGCPELRWTLLHQLQALLYKCPTLLESDFRSFFCKYNEPSYVKTKKLEILTQITSEANYEAIVEELAAYITDIDVGMARRSIRAMGTIAIQFTASLEHVLAMLVQFFDLNKSYITADALLVLQDVLRKYPEKAAELVPYLNPIFESGCLLEEPEAQCALIWMLGEHGKEVEEAPYILEEMIAGIGDESSHLVRLQLLTSTVKLFFLRPPEVQKMLGQLFEFCIDQDVHQDVHDRALLYYRLLQTNIAEAQRIVGAPCDTIVDFAEKDESIGEEVFGEFNTLSVIYGKPATTFVDPILPFIKGGGSSGGGSGGSYAGDREGRAAGRGGGGELLEGDLLEGGFLSSTQGVQLNPDPKLTPQEFETKWTTTEITCVVKDILTKAPSNEQFGQLMAGAKISTLAAAPAQNGTVRFFLFAQELASGHYHLMEVTINIVDCVLTATIKSDGSIEDSNEFGLVFRSALSGAFESA